MDVPEVPAIEVDGHLDDAGWNAATALPLGRHWDGVTPKSAATGRIVRAAAGLVLGVRADDAHLKADLTAHDATTWHDDVFELFVQRAPDADYLELHLTPRGVTADARIPLGPHGGWPVLAAFESGMTAAVALDGTLEPGDVDRGWSAELLVPWSALGGPPEPGETWRFAVCRYDYAADGTYELSSTAPLSKPSFHRRDEWGELRF